MLTARQRDALVFIEEFQSLHLGKAPTHQELADGLGIYKGSSTARLLNDLEERGFISRSYSESHGKASYAYTRSIKVHASVRPRIPIYDADTLQRRGWLP